MLAVFVTLVLLWTAIFFIDVIFKTCMFFPYITALETSGIVIKPFSITWRITRLNKVLRHLGRIKPAILRKWFDFGALVSCFCVFPSIGIFLVSFFHILYSTTPEGYNSQLIVPVVPGYNIPFSHLMYYFLVILLCSAVHELGHAIAASREKISVESCGFAIYGVFPVAYVNLCKEQLKHLSLWQQLRIFCAGIWHNIVLCCLAIAILFSSPFLLSPLYQRNVGVTVVHIEQNSGVAEPAGLNVGDHVYSIDDCEVNNYESWRNCLNVGETLQHGFCSTEEFVSEENIASEGSCCGNSSQHLCFLRSDVSVEKVCLPVRKLIDSSKTCTKDLDCGNPNICLIPILTSKLERLVAIKRKNKKSVIYVGPLQELFSVVTVSSWISRSDLIPANFAEVFETFLVYIVIFSGGLAVLNIIPCPSLDGEYLCENLVHLCLSHYIRRLTDRALIIKGLHIFGVFLVVTSVCITAFKMYKFSL